ncbi:DUF2087 domain-containing protein [Paenibacillus sp. GSMTC-2017]|uniref:DUF2087 domain-containing protein n=1 Tax=Paenibacillus sp. GSMTC-2017 TaxID=2794350 RepID=UPI0018D78E83|nr:DUF2087 domain-containing protein [Paenibacillus sp. GSMTC-2017]MBH5317397.1 DUF2087 domain-containing protein [Paenibacillus sp. GSMTC-2017]
MGNGLDERFWSAALTEMKQGYVYDVKDDHYYCLICGEPFENGEIFRSTESGRFFEAKKYVHHHIIEKHGSVLDYLLGLDKKATGLTELQKEMIRDFAAGFSDNEIVKRTGSGSASTIRNHRFVLKEKGKQAKLLLAIMELMEQGVTDAPQFVTIHRTAVQVDERFAITTDEYGEMIKKYFPDGPKGPLVSFPRKEKKKIAILRHIATFFHADTIYREAEVNEILISFSNKEYVTLRRYLIEYGYLDRKEDGSEYWVRMKGKEEGIMVGKEQKQDSKKEQKKESQGEQTATVTKSTKGPDKAKRKQLTADYQDRERKMGVYQITNNTNGRMFIGGSTNLDGLWNKEKFMLDLGSHSNKEMQKEWKQFGGENFTFEILETVNTDGLIRYNYKDVFDEEGKELGDVAKRYRRDVESMREQWIKKLQPNGDSGYN